MPDELKNKYSSYLLNYYKYRVVNEKLLSAISKLKENNYKIYVLTDNNKEALDYYKNLDCFKIIDGFISSSDYKTIKEEGKLFDIFFQEFNLNPEECYFVDDKKNNLTEAKKRGMKGFCYSAIDDNFDNLLKDMKKHGVKY